MHRENIIILIVEPGNPDDSFLVLEVEKELAF